MAAAIRVMNAASGWRTERDGHVQGTDRQIVLHPITDSPADNAPGMEVQDNGQIQPTLSRPDIADVASPFLVWYVCGDVTIQQVWGNIELGIAVGCDLVFAGPYDRYAVLTHQPANTAMPHIQADLLQLFRHPWSTIAAEAKTRLFLDVSQRHQITSLPATGRTAAEGTQSTRANGHDPTHQFNGKCRSVSFDKLEPHGFWLAKNTVAFFTRPFPP